MHLDCSITNNCQIQCSVPGYGTAGSPFINDGINHLNGVNICDLEAGVWTRVTCSGQSAIYAKNNLVNF